MMPEALLKKQMELYDFISDIFTEAEIIFYFTPELVGEEASGRVDYAIKKIIDVVNEELKEEAFDDFDYLYEFVTTTTNQ
ncbi:unnamed protein product [Rhizophagus irregularis]|nr:unnamed protein product [Rhizophagus irregularis]